MRFRQIVQLLDTRSQPLTEGFTATEGDQRMRELVPLAHGVLGIPGLDERKNSLGAPRARDDHQHEGADQHHDAEKEHPAVDAPQEQDAHRDHRDHHESTHVRFGQQQHADHRQRQRHRRHCAHEPLLDVHLAHHVVGGIHRDCELGQLGRLDVQRPQGNPAARAVHPLADAGDKHQHEQHQRGHEYPRRSFFPKIDGNLHHDEGRHEGQDHEEDLTRHEKRRCIVRELRVVRQCDGGAVDHHDAHRQQPDHDAEQGFVEAEQARWLAAAHLDPVAHRYRFGADVVVADVTCATTLQPRGYAATQRIETGSFHVAVHAATPPWSATIACTSATNTSARCT